MCQLLDVSATDKSFDMYISHPSYVPKSFRNVLSKKF